MKNLLLSLLGIAFISAPAMAQNNNNNMDYDSLSPLSGVYVGAYGGYGWNDVDNDSGADFDVNGGDYGLFVGYKADAILDETINRIGLGLNGAIEVSYGWSSADESIGGATIDKENEFAVNFRPGLSVIGEYAPFGINPYGIIGYRRTKFEGSAFGVSDDESYNGFELGLGTEVFAYGDYGVRLDYSHVWYGEKDGFDPDTDSLRLGVAYHF